MGESSNFVNESTVLKGDASNYFWFLELFGLGVQACWIKKWCCIKILGVSESALVGAYKYAVLYKNM